MNKSRVARDLWRKVFNDNIINLSDGDARKQVVREFLADPVNKKAGWRSKDARFMRLGFSKVAKEQGFNVMSIGVTPTPSRSKTQKGSMNINVKSKPLIVFLILLAITFFVFYSFFYLWKFIRLIL